eukprot:scaffold2310_cov164-Amphora_coffeaeformis.AAC.7
MLKAIGRKRSGSLSRKAQQKVDEGVTGVDSPARTGTELGALKAPSTPETDVSGDSVERETELETEVTHEHHDTVRRQGCKLEPFRTTGQGEFPTTSLSAASTKPQASISSNSEERVGFRPFGFLRSKGSRSQNHPDVMNDSNNHRAMNVIPKDANEHALLARHSQQPLQAGEKKMLEPKKGVFKLLHRFSEVESDTEDDTIITPEIVNKARLADQNSRGSRSVSLSAPQYRSASSNQNHARRSMSPLTARSAKSTIPSKSNRSANAASEEYSPSLFFDEVEQGYELELSELQHMNASPTPSRRWFESSSRRKETSKLAAERALASAQKIHETARLAAKQEAAQSLVESETDATKEITDAAKDLQNAKRKAAKELQEQREAAKRDADAKQNAEHANMEVTNPAVEAKRETDKAEKKNADAAKREAFEPEVRQATAAVLKLDPEASMNIKRKVSKPVQKHSVSSDSMCSEKSSKSCKTASSGKSFQKSDEKTEKREQVQKTQEVKASMNTAGDSLTRSVEVLVSTEDGGISFIRVDPNNSSSTKLPPRVPKRNPAISRLLKQKVGTSDAIKESVELKRSQSAQASLSGELPKRELSHLGLSNDPQEQISRSRSLELGHAENVDRQLLLKKPDHQEQTLRKVEIEAHRLDGNLDEDEIVRSIISEDEKELVGGRIDDPAKRTTSPATDENSQPTMGFSAEWLGDVASAAMSWSFGDEKKNTVHNFTPTGDELVIVEKSPSSAISTAANRSFTYLTAASYPDFVPSMNSKLESFDDSPDTDVVSLAAESGCSAPKVTNIDSFNDDDDDTISFSWEIVGTGILADTDNTQTVGMVQRMAAELVNVLGGHESDEGSCAFNDDDDESDGYASQSLGRSSCEEEETCTSRSLGRSFGEDETCTSRSLGRSYGEDETCTSRSLGSGYEEDETCASFASGPGQSQDKKQRRKSKLFASNARRGRASSRSPNSIWSGSYSPDKRAASRSPSRRASPSRSPSRDSRKMKVISPPNVAPRNNDLTSVGSGSGRATTTRTFSGEIAEEKKDDDFSRRTAALPDPVKASDDPIGKKENAEAQQIDDTALQTSGTMFTSLLGLAKSFGKGIIDPTPDVPSDVIRNQSHEFHEITLTLSGEKDDGSFYSRSFEVDPSDPRKYKDVIVQEISCALSENGTESKRETRYLRAKVAPAGRKTPSELYLKNSKSWGSKSSKPKVQTVQSEEDDGFEDAQSLSTISMSLPREPRDDLTVEIYKRDGEIRTAFVTCESISALMCETMMCSGYGNYQATMQ